MADKSKELKHWQTLERKSIFVDEPWIKLFVEKVKVPSGKHIENFYQLEGQDYVAMMVFTEDRKLIVERQYKHGARSVSLMLPGGGIEKKETPLEAAKRELLEETGYTASDWTSMGAFVLDANQHWCRAHYFIARDAVQTMEPEHDEFEEMEVLLMSEEEVDEAIGEGQVVMLSSLTGILMAKPYWRSYR